MRNVRPAFLSGSVICCQSFTMYVGGALPPLTFARYACVAYYDFMGLVPLHGKCEACTSMCAYAFKAIAMLR